MSEISAGQGWWIASDGNWYPPELHPSVREQTPRPVPTKMHVPVPSTMPSAEGMAAQGWTVEPQQEAPVGPQFPDLFQAALQGSHLADNVTVAGSADSAASDFFTSSRAGSAPPVGAPSGGGSKRRWRKGS